MQLLHKDLVDSFLITNKALFNKKTLFYVSVIRNILTFAARKQFRYE